MVHYAKWTPLGQGAWQPGEFKFNDLLVVDVATKKRTVLKEYGEEPAWRLAGIAWSPDGKRIAYAEYQPLPRRPGGVQEEDPFRVMVADADGGNEKEVYTATGSWLVGFDWK